MKSAWRLQSTRWQRHALDRHDDERQLQKLRVSLRISPARKANKKGNKANKKKNFRDKSCFVFNQFKITAEQVVQQYLTSSNNRNQDS